MPPSYRAGQQFYDAAVDALDRQGQAGDLTLKLDTYLERWVTGIETGQIEDLKALAQKAEALAESMGDRARLAQWRGPADPERREHSGRPGPHPKGGARGPGAVGAARVPFTPGHA